MRLSVFRQIQTAGIFLAIGCCVTFAKEEKKKIILPEELLQARTALVVIDPDAGMAETDPTANQRAQKDVEQALTKWGRFGMAMDVSTADVVIVIRKGTGRLVRPTVGGVPNNNRPVVFDPSDTDVRLGGRSGTPPTKGDPTAPQASDPKPQIEAGQADDQFAVYLGKREDVLNRSPAWRYVAKDGLRSPGVPAVEQFRKAIAEAEKQKP